MLDNFDVELACEDIYNDTDYVMVSYDSHNDEDWVEF